jgi:hypothetical protein
MFEAIPAGYGGHGIAAVICVPKYGSQIAVVEQRL